MCHPFLHVIGEPVQRRGRKCLSPGHTAALTKGKRRVHSARGIGDTSCRNWTWLVPCVRALIPDSSRRHAASQWKVLQSLFQIWESWKGFQDIVWTGCHGDLFPTGRANGLGRQRSDSSSCIPCSTRLFLPFPIGHTLVFLAKRTEWLVDGESFVHSSSYIQNSTF